MRLRHLVIFGIPTVGLAVALAMGTSASAPPVDEAARLRCASRLALSLTGTVPDAALASAADPQSQVDALLESPAFIDSFSRFINSQFNNDPGETLPRDASYFLARYVLQNHRPWHELFDGPYDVIGNGSGGAQVVSNPDGLGYFRSPPWMARYAGNEQAGLRLVSAFRIQQNIIGLDVSAVTTAPGVDISAAGRMSSACSGCHYSPYFALDKVAKILSRVGNPGKDNLVFIPPTGPAQTILDGKLIHNDKELIGALVDSTNFKFRTCRLAFQYLYGRAEANCEAPLFDKCIDTFTQTGDIRAALKTIAQDDGFCE